MELYLNPKVSKITVVNIMETLLKDFIAQGVESGDYKLVEDLEDVNPIIDYVRDFIDIYIEDNKLGIDKIGKSYIINRIYSAKGGPETIEILNSIFGSSIYYDYDFPKLGLTIDTLTSSDLMLFVNKLDSMLNVVMFFNEPLELVINNIILKIRDTLISYGSISIKPYFIIPLTEE